MTTSQLNRLLRRRPHVERFERLEPLVADPAEVARRDDATESETYLVSRFDHDEIPISRGER